MRRGKEIHSLPTSPQFFAHFAFLLAQSRIRSVRQIRKGNTCHGTSPARLLVPKPYAVVALKTGDECLSRQNKMAATPAA